MKLIIKDINKNKKTFYCYIGNRKIGFYLTNRLAKIFFDLLEEGVLVDFEISSNEKRIGKRLYHQVMHFNEIKKLTNSRALYNHKKLKKDMVTFLEEKDYFLFLDLEMTIPYPRQRNFIPEIVQYGLYLTNKEGNSIFEDGSYVKTELQNPVSRRTFRFLNIGEDIYHSQAKHFDHFYQILKAILDKYNPKIVVWGKNDIIAIEHSYNIHKVEELTTRNNFIDLLKLHKDYFNLKNDLGLFKAYETYYEKSFAQVHDAKADAKVTKKVFDAFLEYSSLETKNS